MGLLCPSGDTGLSPCRPHGIRHPLLVPEQHSHIPRQGQAVPLDSFNGKMNSKLFAILCAVTKSPDYLMS